MNLWTVAKLTRLPLSLRRKLRFYAPLVESLDFMGVEPATFLRASASSAIYRDGTSHTIAAHVPRFQYDGDLPIGLLLSAGETFKFAPANELHLVSNLIWFEDLSPKSTPTNANPFNSSGVWIGNRDVHIKHIVAPLVDLTIAEINRIQVALEDVAQPLEEPPPVIPVTGQFHEEEFTGPGTVFTLSADPDLNSLLIDAHGLQHLRRVAFSPGSMQYTASGIGNRTITLGLSAAAGSIVAAQYVVA